MTIDIDSLIEPDLSMSARGPTDDLYIRYLRIAGQAICRDIADFWLHDIAEPTLLSTANEIDLADPTLPTDSRIYQIDRLTTRDDLDEVVPIPHPYLWNEQSAKIVVGRAGRTEDLALTVTAALEPTDGADTFPDFFQNWRTALTSRALADLLNQPKTDWFNPQMAMEERRKYMHRMGDAKVRRMRGNTRRPLRMKPHPFA